MSTLLEEAHDVLQTICRRRAVRGHAAQRPDVDMIHATLDAAVQALPAMHAEPLAFVICRKHSCLFKEADCWLGPKI